MAREGLYSIVTNNFVSAMEQNQCIGRCDLIKPTPLLSVSEYTHKQYMALGGSE